jgi:hypothetical protein
MKRGALLALLIVAAPALAEAFTHGYVRQPPAGGFRAPCKGLVSMGDISWYRKQLAPSNNLAEPLAKPGLFKCVGVMLRWSDIQPTSGGALVTTSLDTALANVAAYNALYPATPIAVKLSVSGGSAAPSWALALAGGPMTIQTNGPWSQPVWWSSAYHTAWTSMLGLLAAYTDGNPLIEEVRVSSCNSNTLDEGWNNPTGNSTDLATVNAAGFTDTLGLACLQAAIADFSVWKRPALDLAVNPYHSTTAGYQVLENANDLYVLTLHRLAFGAQGVIANHGLAASLPSNLTPIYSQFCAMGGAVEMQFASPGGQTSAGFTTAQSGCVTELEIWDTTATDGSATTTLSTLQGWSTALGGY